MKSSRVPLLLLLALLVAPGASWAKPVTIAPPDALQVAAAEGGEEDLFGSGDDLFADQGDSLFGDADSLDEAPEAAAEEPAAEAPEEAGGDDLFGDSGGELDLFANIDTTTNVVEVPPEKSRWLTIGGPVGLFLFFFLVLWINKAMVPFKLSRESIALYHYPTGVKRGLAFAISLYGIAFVFGASEIAYQIEVYGSGAAYFDQMSQGKLIAFTHAHLFGFTTSFLIIGIPFSMQFNHIPAYQWMLPVGLAACFVDIISWWGIKYLHPNFEYISMFCGIMFTVTYMFMLIGLLRVLLFPGIVWRSDKDREERLAKLREKRRAGRESIGGAL